LLRKDGECVDILHTPQTTAVHTSIGYGAVSDVKIGSGRNAVLSIAWTAALMKARCLT
jgi:hypothetical protein